MNANKPIWDDGDTLRGSKKAEKAHFDTFWPFFGTGGPYVSCYIAYSSRRSIVLLWTPHMAILREKNLGPKFLGDPILVVGAKWTLFGPWMPLKRPKTIPEGITMVVPNERDQLVYFWTNCIHLGLFGPSKRAKRAVLSPFGAPRSDFMVPKHVKEHDINI